MMCKSMFTNKWTTVQHLHRSFHKGFGSIQRGPYVDVRVVPEDLTCPMAQPNKISNASCSYIGYTLDDLQEHIAREHSWWQSALQ